MPLVGLALSLALILRNNLEDLWIVWAPGQFSLLYPLYGYFWWKRRRQLIQALLDWNR